MRALIEVFFRPAALFEALPSRPASWLLPLILNALLAVAVSWMVPHYVGRETAIRQGAQAAKMNPEQTAALVKQLTRPGNIAGGYVFLAVEFLLFQLILAGALYAFALMSSRPPDFGPMLSMVALALFPYMLVVAGATFAALATASDPTKLNSLNLLPTNPAAFEDPNSLGKGIYGLLSSVDGLVFLEIGLLSLGLSRLTKWSYGLALGAIGGLWVLYMSVKTVMGLMF